MSSHILSPTFKPLQGILEWLVIENLILTIVVQSQVQGPLSGLGKDFVIYRLHNRLRD
jgi:hypothetical protein